MSKIELPDVGQSVPQLIQNFHGLKFEYSEKISFNFFLSKLSLTFHTLFQKIKEFENDFSTLVEEYYARISSGFLRNCRNDRI